MTGTTEENQQWERVIVESPFAGNGEPIVKQIGVEFDAYKFVNYVQKKHREDVKRRRKPTQLRLLDGG